MSKSPVEDPYELVSPLLKLAEDWVALPDTANIPLELAVHELRSRGDWRISISRTFERIEGVSVVMPRAHWYLEAVRPPIAEMLSKIAFVHGRRPVTLTTSERVGKWLRPFLEETGGIQAENGLVLLKCTRPPASHDGRWATADDVPRLQQYESEIDRDRRRYMDTSWEVLVAIKGLAVIEGDDRSILASIRRYGPTPSYAAVSDLFVLPLARRHEIATNLAGFVVGEMLARRKTVYVLVDQNDESSLAFYRAIGFEDDSIFYRAYLE